jgi:hypothetical protein
MDKPVRQPNILHLCGISLSDYVPIEDVFDEKLMETVDKPLNKGDELPHNSIPPVFTSVDKWPLSTNLRCWSCSFTFDGPPRFVPTHYRPARTTGKFDIGVEGNFCCWNCAALYIDERYSSQANAVIHWRMRSRLCLVYRLFTKTKVTHIKPALSKTELKEYGGKLSKDEFWEKLRALDPEHGLRDHRPSIIIPERLRTEPLVDGVSIWEVCGETKPTVAKTAPESVPAPRTAYATRRNNVAIERPSLSGTEIATELERIIPPPKNRRPEKTPVPPKDSSEDMDALLEELSRL